MREWWRVLGGACSAFAVAACSGRAGGDAAPRTDVPDDAALSRFEVDLAGATTRRDSTMIARMLAPGWVITLADGRTSTRARALARWTRPRAAGIVRDTAIVDSVVIRRTGPGAAVLTAAIIDIDVRASGAETTWTRVTDVVVWRDGRWQAVVSHESVRPPQR